MLVGHSFVQSEGRVKRKVELIVTEITNKFSPPLLHILCWFELMLRPLLLSVRPSLIGLAGAGVDKDFCFLYHKSLDSC